MLNKSLFVYNNMIYIIYIPTLLSDINSYVHTAIIIWPVMFLIVTDFMKSLMHFFSSSEYAQVLYCNNLILAQH